MSHFYGTLQGARGPASRCGSKGSGICTHAASWEGAVCANVYLENDIDWARVSLTTWQGRGINMLLYDGPVGGGNEINAAHNDLRPQFLDRTWILTAGAPAVGVEMFQFMLKLMTAHQVSQVCDFLREKGIEV